MTGEEFSKRINGAQVVNGNGEWSGRCPAHGDQHVSLGWRDGRKGLVITCRAGCETKDVLAALGLTFRDIFHDPRNDHRALLTVETLAASKRLTAEFLRSLGVEQNGKGVMISYRRLDGTPAPRQRLRTAIAAKDGSSWTGPKGQKLEPYGSWRLADARKAGYVLVVEGESDCWAAWLQGFPALGVPGANMATVLRREHLDWIGKVYVVREPDRGGRTFAEKIPARLRELGWSGTALIVNMPDGIKDVNALHCNDPERFQERLRHAMDSGVPASVVGEEVADALAPRDFKLTDLGNAERLVAKFGADLRYVPEWGWMVWDGQRWRRDRGQVGIMRLATKAVRSMYGEAEGIDADTARRRLTTHAQSSEARARLEAMIGLAEHQIAASSTDFDHDPWLLNVKNGTVDLKTGELRPQRREDFITRLAPAPYDPDGAAPTWGRFLQDITGGNVSLAEFLQKAMGYALTGRTTEQVFFLFYGAGANGKSTFLTLISEAIGDYAMQAATETFMVKREGAIPNDVARLKGARLVTAVETEDGRRLAEARVKQLTGGDPVTARFLNHEFFDFTPEFKLVIAANHRPRVQGTEHAFWRRMRLVPFNATFRSPDMTMADRLRAELSGILAWAVRGCMAWQKEGLRPPRAVEAATNAYRQEEDALTQFLDDCCVVAQAAKVRSSDLYESYSAWCQQNHERPLTQKKLGSRLTEKGFENTKSGVKSWRGVGLRDDRDRSDHLAGFSSHETEEGGKPVEKVHMVPMVPDMVAVANGNALATGDYDEV